MSITITTISIVVCQFSFDTMGPKTYLLVSIIISNVFAKECPGKIISDYVCIPQNYTNSNDESPQDVNHINVSLIDVQVVKFDDLVEKLTLKMILKIRWLDNRLQLTKETKKILIRDDDHIELWRPVFNIQNLVSTVLYNLAGRTSSQVYAIRILKENVTLVSSVTNIYATTHCGLFLQKFPFDQQSCTFKVKTKYHFGSIKPILGPNHLPSSLEGRSLLRIMQSRCFNSC